jgi:hypothetical protein
MTHYTSNNPAHIGTVVFLDGVEIQDVMECDTSDGWVLRMKLNDDGKIYEIDGNLATEKLFGIVTVNEPMNLDDIFSDDDLIRDGEADRQRIFEETGMVITDALPASEDSEGSENWQPLEFVPVNPTKALPTPQYKPKVNK